MKRFFNRNDDTLHYPNKRVDYEPSIVDFLNNDFKPTLFGVKGTILRLLEKNFLTLEKKIVNLSTPWQPDEKEIIQLSLTPNVTAENVTLSEDFMIRWLIFTYGDGVHANISKVLDAIHDEDFIATNHEMYDLWQFTVFRQARALDLFAKKPLQHGLNQSKLYKELTVYKVPSMAMVYGIFTLEKEEVIALLSLFDQTL